MKNLKIILVALLLFTTISFVNTGKATAASNITIYVNNVKQSYSNKAILKNGSTLVPLRGIFEALGADVNWNQATKTIDATKGSTKVWLKIGSKATKVNGKVVNIAVPAQVVKGSTLVPLRFIGESLGAQVQWNQATKTINIVADDMPMGKPPVMPKPPVTPPTKPQPGTKYKNCTELRKDYPNGVPSSHPAYDKKHDRDGDGWACEK